MTMPDKKAKRQPNSERCRPIKPPMMPLMPAMRPLNNKNSVAAKPIKIPPEKAETGVKLSKNLTFYR